MYSSVMNNPPKWASAHQANVISAQSSDCIENQNKKILSPTQRLEGENTDEHFSRHLDNLNATNENDEEPQAENDEESDLKIAEANEKMSSLKSNLLMNNVDDEEDDPKYDEPKVFQVEDVDLPSLITKPNSKPTSPLMNIVKSENFAFTKAPSLNKPNFIGKLNLINNGTESNNKQSIIPVAPKLIEQISLNAEINLTSTMATPVHYFSRSSSMTSLNSFDVKSIHSEIASEYSQVTSQVTSPCSKPRRDAEFNHSDYLDDLENLNMPESPSALENSFLNAQRYIHKQQQQIYRQNAAVAMNCLNQHPVLNGTLNFQQANKITMNSNSFKIVRNDGSAYNSITQQANLVKPWNMNTNLMSSKNTTTTLIQKSSKNNDLNIIMSRLNINKNSIDKGNNQKAVKLDSESSESDTASDSSDSLSFLNENQTDKRVTNKEVPSKDVASKPLNMITNSMSINHTPPVKLQAAPKFIQNQTTTKSNGSTNNELANITNTKMASNQSNQSAGLNQMNSNSAPSMSVSYAFMKNSTSHMNQPSCMPSNQQKTSNMDSSNQQQTVVPPLMPNQYIPNLYQPKFLQSSNQSYQVYQQHAMQFNQNPFNQSNNAAVTLQNQQSKQHQSSSSSSSSSSQNSQVNQQVSPTNSDAPYVYMVEKTSNVLTPQASKAIRPQFSDNDRPPSPQESVCSRMSDSSIPSLIRQDISRTTQGFQQIKKQPQNDFKALFSKLNQNNSVAESSQPMQKFSFMNNEPKPQNNLMPAFNFLKSQNNFNQSPVFFNHTNTPVNTNSNPNVNFSDLDCTYSPKVFENEGTNTRYDSENSFIEDEEQEENNVIQNSTQIEKPNNQEDNDELLLENFIKEMLPPVATSPEHAPRPRMASSISSEAPFVQLTKKTKFRNSGSSSSLNSLSKPRINFSRSEKTMKQTKITPKPITAPSKPLKQTFKKAEETKMTAKKVESTSSKKPMTSNISKTNSNKSLNKIQSTAPVVAMTKTAQLRMAKMASSNNSNNNNMNLNRTISSINPPKQINRPKPLVRETANRPAVNNKETASSVQVNPHLDHLNRNGVRRKSFTCGTSGIKSKKDFDTAISSATTHTNTVKQGVTVSKPKSTWK